jgi:hypothetical protein
MATLGLIAIDMTSIILCGIGRVAMVGIKPTLRVCLNGGYSK